MLLLPFILFLLLSVSYVISQQDIQANLVVVPTPILVDCKPDEVIVGNKLKWLNCFIEIPNANVNQIDLETLRLSVTGKTGYAYADPTFSNVDDYDMDGIEDLQVRFNNTKLNDTFFSDVSTTTLFTLKINGLVSTLPFSGTDTLLLVKSSGFDKASYVRIDSDINTVTINRISGIDLSKFTFVSAGFDGVFANIGDPKIVGGSTLYVRGELEERILFIFTRKIPVLIAAIFKDYDNCFLDKEAQRMHCEGTGVLLIRNERTWDITRSIVTNLRFEIENEKATVEGGQFWNDIISVSNVPAKIRVR